MSAEQELQFTLTFNAQTGELTAVQNKLEEVQAAAEGVGAATQAGSEEATAAVEQQTVEVEKLGAAHQEAGNKGSDGLAKIESRLTRVALNLALMQLALTGFMAVAKDNEAFQELQQTFMNLAGNIFSDFGPALELVSRGLQGVVQWIGALSAIASPVISAIVADAKAGVDLITSVILAVMDLGRGQFKQAKADLDDGVKQMKDEFKGIGDQFAQGWGVAVQRFGEGVDTMTNKSTTFTKAMASIHEAEITAAIAHRDAMAKIQIEGLTQQMHYVDATAAQKATLRKQQTAIELATLKADEDDKLKIIDDKQALDLAHKEKYHAEKIRLQQATADKEKAIEAKLAADLLAAKMAETEKLRAALDAQSKAMADAAAQKILAAGNANEALRAAGAAEIKMLGDTAASAIELHGAKAAAAAFDAAASVAPPFASFAAGAAAAAPVLLWYTALATGVNVAAGAFSSAVGGGGGAASSTSSAPTAPATAASGSNSAGAVASSPSSSQSPTASAGNGGSGNGMTQVTVSVFLDSAVILKVVHQGAQDGNLIINAKAIV